MNRGQVNALHSLFMRRDQLIKAMDHAKKLSVWEEAFKGFGNGTGTNSLVVDAVGGTESFRSLMGQACVNLIEREIRLIDQRITEKGGNID